MVELFLAFEPVVAQQARASSASPFAFPASIWNLLAALLLACVARRLTVAPAILLAAVHVYVRGRPHSRISFMGC